MMRTSCWLLVLALAGPGCLSSGTHVTETSSKTPPVQMSEAPTPPPVVTPDQVTEKNAVEMAHALSRELDQEPAAPATTEAQPSAMKP